MARRRTYNRIVVGIDEVDQMLRTLKTGAANRVARATLRPALTHVVRAARRRSPKASFKPAVRKTNKFSKRSKMHQAKVGLNVGLKKGDQRTIPEPLWYILGTRERRRGNKLKPGEKALPASGFNVPGPRGKRGIGGKFAWMETVKPEKVWKRRTGKMSSHQSFIKAAADAEEPQLKKIMYDAYVKALAKEARKHGVGKTRVAV